MPALQNKHSSITFEKVNFSHQSMIFKWLAEPHMQEFWDNSWEHKEDIINFINRRVTPSSYFNGIFTYWIGKIDNEPFCFILTAKVNEDDDLPLLLRKHLSKTGTTYSLDFGIGNVAYLGKKLSAPTLKLFTEFFQNNIDLTADTFFIDPAENNPRARHVYEKAGFERVGEFEMDRGVFTGEETVLMVKRIVKGKSI
jgi:RimJ/RimL family protein N-acetyltransferase